MALATQDADRVRKEVYDYYPIFGPFAEFKANALLTIRRQVRDAITAFADIGADELMFYTWSSDPEQIDRLADNNG
ncbi:MAG TPA: hypothetical protein VGN34_19950 [Ktedonobacteraceae bacterium]